MEPIFVIFWDQVRGRFGGQFGIQNLTKGETKTGPKSYRQKMLLEKEVENRCTVKMQVKVKVQIRLQN